MKTVIFILLLSTTLHAEEPTPLRWDSHRTLAEALSNVFVASNLTVDSIDAIKHHHIPRSLCSVGLTLLSTESTKRLVHRTRPDQSDRKSFPSMHTALAATSARWRVNIAIPIAVGAGYHRMAADKHYLSDVAAGATMGAFSSWLCTRWFER